MSVIHYGQPGLTYGAGFTYGQNVTPVSPLLTKAMKQAALKLDEKDIAQCMDLGQSIEQGLTGKPAFASVLPTPATMAAKRAAIDVLQGNKAAAEAALTLVDNALDALELDYRNSLTLQASSAVVAVNGDEAQLTAANIPLRQPGTPASDAPDPVSNPQGSYGDLSGEADFAWDGKSGTVYVAETAASVNGPFAHAYSGKRSKFTSKNNAPGSEVFMRVKCTCNGFDSNWSQVVSQRAR